MLLLVCPSRSLPNQSGQAHSDEHEHCEKFQIKSLRSNTNGLTYSTKPGRMKLSPASIQDDASTEGYASRPRRSWCTAVIFPVSGDTSMVAARGESWPGSRMWFPVSTSIVHEVNKVVVRLKEVMRCKFDLVKIWSSEMAIFNLIARVSIYVSGRSALDILVFHCANHCLRQSLQTSNKLTDGESTHMTEIR